MKSDNFVVNGYLEFFEECWGKEKPKGKLIKSSTNNGFLYDTGTNKILRCEDEVFKLLEMFFSMAVEPAIRSYISVNGTDKFLNAAQQIKNAIETENILLAKKATQFGAGDHYKNIGELIDSFLGILILEVTESCNLRCGYCIYNTSVDNTRNHGTTHMSLDVAQAAINYFKTHSSRKDNLAITFYGGEPLLRFPMIKKCVQYTKEVFKNREVEFNITTNATLLTPEIINYFFENRFVVTVSLDGPKDIHNRYRKDINGKGTFEKVIKNLENIVRVYDKAAREKLIISMVYMPPFSEANLDRIAALWKELPWLPKDINIRITYPTPGTIALENFSKDELKEDKDLSTWISDYFQSNFTKKDNAHPIVNSLAEKNLAQLMQRPIFKKPTDKYVLNGCCVPGVRKLFVTVNGDFHVCEKISTDAPILGNVFLGCDLSVINDFYIKEYEKISLHNCSECWAIRLCSLCYIRAIKQGHWDALLKSEACFAEMNSKQNLLSLFCSLAEKDIKQLNYLYHFKLT